MYGDKTRKEAQRECEAHVAYMLFVTRGQAKETLIKHVNTWGKITDSDKKRLIDFIEKYPEGE